MSVMQGLLESGDWFDDAEIEVLVALLMRIWNTTGRPELGGRSPDAAQRRHRRRRR